MKFLLECIKDKNLNSKFSSFFQTPNFQFKIFIPKFSIPHSHCPIFKSKPSISRFQKNSNLRFHDQNFKILNLKISDFKFQISIQNLKVSKSQNIKCQFRNFQVSKIKCFSKIESFIN